MVKKGLVALVLAAFVAGGVFAQEEYKHQPFDMLLGINSGLGVSPNIGGAFNLQKGNYAITFDLGLTYDFYLFNWLSFNTGLLLHPDIYVLLDQDQFGDDNFTKYAATPVCLTIPLAAHINVPKVEWLYAGVGLNLNIPVSSMLDDTVIDIDTKGDFFIGLPIDIGFDFIKPGKGGSRFFFRITPEIHENGTTLPVGFMWQVYNWKIYSK
ncbi:MAG: hypothetical protein LBC62_05295 [Treponema sp.]|jgi:hypothetical protein|nr:hypothetical protein [Treponema sp.]